MRFRYVWALLLAMGGAMAADGTLVVNKGLGGHSTRDGLYRYERDVTEVKPDHLILYFGMNDALNSGKLVPLAEYRRNLQTMVDRARAGGVESLVLVTPNPIVGSYVKKRHPKHPQKDLAAWLATYDQVVRELAEKNGIPLADLRRRVTEHCANQEDRKSLIRNLANHQTTDGVHLTAEGYRIMAELIAETLGDRVKAGETVVCFGDSITFGAGMKGAGTSYGETYPAWLSLLLNKKLGLSKEPKPPVPPERDPEEIPWNGSFETAYDRVHPDGWSMYNWPGKQEGAMHWEKADDAPQGRSVVRIENADAEKPAYLLYRDLLKLEGGVQLRFSCFAKGTGQLRQIVAFYNGKRRQIGAQPDVKDNPFRSASPTWQTHHVDVSAPDETRYARLIFRATGRVYLDGVKLAQRQQTRAAILPRADTVLRNGILEVGFAPVARGAGIVSLRNSVGQELIKRPAPHGLWKLLLRRIPRGPAPGPTEFVKLSLDPERDDSGASDDDGGGKDSITLSAAKAGGTVEVTAGEHSLTLGWQGIDIGQEKGVLDVTVTATLSPDDPFVRFRTKLSNRSAIYTAFYVTSPYVQGIFPADGDTTQDYLATPCFTGRLIRDPMRHGILGKPRRFQPNRSGHSMQFDAYYNAGSGLYLGCFDGDQNIKRYEMEATRKGGFCWGVVHVPDNMRAQPQTWSTSYDTVLRPFAGDWYDAARIYREWALQQSWAAEGPVLTRKSTPKWFKEIDEWMMWGVGKELRDLVYDPLVDDVLKDCRIGHWATGFGKSAEGIHLSETPDCFPLKADDKTYIQKSQAAERPIMAYIQGVCWDIKAPSFLRENGWDHTVRNFDGKRVIWDFTARHGLKCAIAWPGKVWERALGDSVEKMAKAGMRGAYLDSNNHGGTYMNFNPLYTKQVGGGNAYIKANHRMVKAIRERARKVDPEFCFTAESFWEGNMGILDAYLACNTTYQYLDGDQVTAIPLAQAVYHDYAIMYSSWVGRHDLQEEAGKGYVAKFAQTLVWGVKPGWNQPTFLKIFRNKEVAVEFSRKRYAAYRAGKDFLLYGEMLRPPKFIEEPEKMDLRWYRSWGTSYYDIKLPKVLRSLWKAPDGRTGLVLYNISAEEQEAKLWVPLGRGRNASVVYPADGSVKPDIRHMKGPATIRVSLPPRSPAIIAWR